MSKEPDDQRVAIADALDAAVGLVVWVPDIGVTSCDLRVLMDQPTEAISP